MVNDPDELLPKKTACEIVIGQDLAALSEHELIARIATLESEIARSREAIKARQATKSAADAFFKKILTVRCICEACIASKSGTYRSLKSVAFLQPWSWFMHRFRAIGPCAGPASC